MIGKVLSKSKFIHFSKHLLTLRFRKLIFTANIVDRLKARESVDKLEGMIHFAVAERILSGKLRLGNWRFLSDIDKKFGKRRSGEMQSKS